MIGWVILLLVFFGAIWGLIYSSKRHEYDTGNFFVSIMVPIVIIILVFIIYYFDKIGYPISYQRVNTNIKEVKELISNKTLILADTDMNKKLAELVIEKNKIIYIAKENNISPFVLFKIKLK